MLDKDERYQNFVERYRSDDVPWDDTLPPPEVIDLTTRLSPGKALDLGCGYGRTAIYLARQGWVVDAIDFVPQAIEEARRRAQQASVADKINFHQSSVTALDFLNGHYTLGIDIGCMHVLDEDESLVYCAQLRRLLSAGATYLLFVRLEAETETNEKQENGPRGIEEETIHRLFDDGFALEKVERGVTKMADKPVWHSGWFWFRRQ